MTAKKWWWLWLWALAIGYAQVYVGKHYPSDIIAGAILGVTIGWLLSVLFRDLLPGFQIWFTGIKNNHKSF